MSGGKLERPEAQASSLEGQEHIAQSSKLQQRNRRNSIFALPARPQGAQYIDKRRKVHVTDEEVLKNRGSRTRRRAHRKHIIYFRTARKIRV